MVLVVLLLCVRVISLWLLRCKESADEKRRGGCAFEGGRYKDILGRNV